MNIKSRALTLAGLLAAVSTVAAIGLQSGKPRLVLSAPDTMTVGDTVSVAVSAFDASGHRVPTATIQWQTVSSLPAVLQSLGAMARLSAADTAPLSVTAVWVDSAGHWLAWASRSIVVVPAAPPPPVIAHVSIYGQIVFGPQGLIVDSTSFLRMTVGDTLKRCLHIVAWSINGQPVTGLPAHLSTADTTVLKIVPDVIACPDTTVDPAAVARGGLSTTPPAGRRS